LGTGATNTTSIVNACATSTIAARICDNLITGGYSDWYLPSRDELSKLYQNRFTIGGFGNATYWSSSQFNSTNSWSYNFSNGATGAFSKNLLYYVRAIRRF
jgi:hypothetical protein